MIVEDIYEDAEEDYEGEYDEEVGAGDAPCILPTGNLHKFNLKIICSIIYIQH